MIIRHITVITILLIIFLALSSCEVIPDIWLGVTIDDWYKNADPDDTIHIEYTLVNRGSVDLENVQVRFGIDDDSDLDVLWNELIGWTPVTGVDIAVNDSYSDSVDSVFHYDPVDLDPAAEHVFVYDVSMDNPPDEE